MYMMDRISSGALNMIPQQGLHLVEASMCSDCMDVRKYDTNLLLYSLITGLVNCDNSRVSS